MSAPADLIAKLRRSLRGEWVVAPAVTKLQIALAGRDVDQVLRHARWGCYAIGAAALPLSIAQFGPTDQEKFFAEYAAGPQLGWLVGDLIQVIASLVFLVVFVYLGRHVPVGGHFPDCSTCGREHETAHASADDRRICRRCARVLDKEMALVEYAERRPLTTW